MTAIIRSYTFTNARVCNPDGSSPTALDFKGAQIQFDKSWSPYCQATFTVGALTGAQVAALEPRFGMRLRFTLTEVDMNGASYSSTYDLGLRSREQSWLTGEMRLTAATDEALMQDFGYLATQQPAGMPVGPGSGLLYATDVANSAVIDALGRAMVIVAGSPQLNIDATEDTAAGSSSWDWAGGLAEAAGAWLWCDELGTVRWAGRDYVPGGGGTRNTSDADAVIDVTDTVSRDDPSFGNAVVIAYTGASPTTYIANSAGVTPRKTITINRARKRPSNGSAQAPRVAAQARGRSLRVRAAADVRARPNQAWQVSWLGQSATGTVQSVAFDFPAGTMDLLINI